MRSCVHLLTGLALGAALAATGALAAEHDEIIVIEGQNHRHGVKLSRAYRAEEVIPIPSPKPSIAGPIAAGNLHRFTRGGALPAVGGGFVASDPKRQADRSIRKLIRRLN